jgi:hypothetical protein
MKNIRILSYGSKDMAQVKVFSLRCDANINAIYSHSLPKITASKNSSDITFVKVTLTLYLTFNLMQIINCFDLILKSHQIEIFTSGQY